MWRWVVSSEVAFGTADLRSPECRMSLPDQNALAQHVGLSTRGGVDSQRNRADRICGYVRTHKNLSVYICQQMMVSVPPNIRRLASHFILFPNRISRESIPLMAKSCMIERKHMEQLFNWAIESGPYGFVLICNEPDGRSRVRINGNRDVAGIV